MNRRKFFRLIGAGAASMAVPKLLVEEKKWIIKGSEQTVTIEQIKELHSYFLEMGVKPCMAKPMVVSSRALEIMRREIAYAHMKGSGLILGRE